VTARPLLLLLLPLPTAAAAGAAARHLAGCWHAQHTTDTHRIPSTLVPLRCSPVLAAAAPVRRCCLLLLKIRLCLQRQLPALQGREIICTGSTSGKRFILLLRLLLRRRLLQPFSAHAVDFVRG
jgi:hypothetical protein